jgi:hypothetical protein
MSMNCKPRCGKLVILVLLGVAALSGIVMVLWNWLIPTLFVGAKPIDYLQAVGILLLSRILFGGFRGYTGRTRWHHQEWERMTPEEREKLQTGIRKWCGSGKQDSPGPTGDRHD